MVHAPSDCEAWLPRRAAQALTNVVNRLDAASDCGRSASAELTNAVQAIFIDIPVYGRLLLPAEFPLAHWGFLLRRALCSAAALTGGTQLALKTGAYAAPIVCSLLEPADSLIYTVRHPAETVIGLTESVVDGMRPAEAVDYVDLHLRQAKRVLAAAKCPTLVIRLENLVSCTDAVLTELAITTKLSDEAHWRRASTSCAARRHQLFAALGPSRCPVAPPSASRSSRPFLGICMTAGLPALAPHKVADVDRCVALLRAYGLVVVDGWATGERLEQLLAEHQRVFAGEVADACDLDYYPSRHRIARSTRRH